ncbi:MAG TPA: Holliday junction branch migration protein RuvA [Pyrinomonadaceae bacterium]|jgi:Holliday junction DNA helicase RuvA|nr:Holliday junction branch migration protein RuvA [Pyrinomonadaceae bacterium]
MIAFLSGKLLAKHPGTLILDVQGVGYEVSIPLSTFYEVGEVDSDVQLHIYTHVREDALQLFGFRTRRERELFMQLISVSGVGAKMAIAMLSSMSTDEIILALRTENLAKLTAIPGVGRKTAERLVIELRDKVMKMLAPETESSALSDAKEKQEVDLVFDDALSALVNLGYQRQAAEKALKSAVNEGTEVTVQKLLRRSLQLLAK